MALDPLPGALWPGYAYDGLTDTLMIPRAALMGLGIAAANAESGDWRQVTLALESTLWSHYASLAAEDRPASLVVKPPGDQAVSYGDFQNKRKITFSVDCFVEFAAQTMVPEPTP